MSTSTATTDRRDVLVQGSEAHAVRTSHPPQPPSAIAEALQNRSAHAALPAGVPLSSRVAMRIGLWLLLWGTRPAPAAAAGDQAVRRRESRARRIEQALAERRAELERARAAAGLTQYLGPFGR